MHTVEFGRGCTASSPISNWYNDWNPKVMHISSTHQAYEGTSGDQSLSHWWLTMLDSNMWAHSMQNTLYKPSKIIVKFQRTGKSRGTLGSASSRITKSRFSTYPFQDIYKRHYTSFNIVDQCGKSMHHIYGNNLTMQQPRNLPRQMKHLYTNFGTNPKIVANDGYTVFLCERD